MIRFVTAAALPLALIACQAQPKPEPLQPPKPMIVGGYASADLKSPQVMAAQKVAVDEIYKRDPQRGIVEKVTAEQQVVAGMNYRFDIKMTGANHYKITVFKPLQGEMGVTAFEKLP